jgi:hypothetical protein
MGSSLQTILFTGFVYMGWVVIPLVPSLILYWFIKDVKFDVESVLSSLKVKASGPVGLYFVVLYFGHGMALSALPEHTTVWRVYADIETDEDAADPTLWVDPMHLAGTRKCEFVVVSQTVKFTRPEKLNLEIPGGEHAEVRFVDLEEGKDYVIDEDKRHVRLQNPIRLAAPSEYPDDYHSDEEMEEVSLDEIP